MKKSRQNEAPRLFDPLVTLGAKLAETASRLGDEVGLAQNTYAKIAADLHAVTGRIGVADGSGLGAQAVYNQAKSDKTTARIALQKKEAEARNAYRACMSRLKPELGYSWNAKWHAAGFSNGSIALPKDVLPALLQLRAFFAENPESEQARLGMTAWQMAQAAAELQVARTEALQAERRRVAAKQARDAALRTLYKRVVAVRRELLQLLSAEDPRWLEFGYNRLIDGPQPVEVMDVNVRPGGEQEAIISWAPSPRAKKYRVTVQEEGEAEGREVLTAGTEVVMPIGGLGRSLLVSVTALNRSGETRPVQVPFSGESFSGAMAERPQSFANPEADGPMGELVWGPDGG